MINVEGNLVLDGILQLGPTPNGMYRLFNYTGALTDNGLDIIATTSGYMILTDVAGEVNLLVSFVPEPSTLVLLGASLLGLMFRRRRPL